MSSDSFSSGAGSSGVGSSSGGSEAEGVEPDETIVCVDCGGPCHLLTHPREDGRWYAGDIVSYRCRDCLDRWDLELPATSS